MKCIVKRTISIFLSLLIILLLPVTAFAEEYDLADGDITVTAKNDKQYVSVAGGVTDNTVTITAEAGQTAEVTLGGVNIDCSATGEAAVSTGGAGNVNIELDGDNTLQSGANHAGLEKNNGGSLSIGDRDNDGSLTATGGDYGAGIGGGFNGGGNAITISGGTVTAAGGCPGGTGIGGGARKIGTDVTVSGDAQVKVRGGEADSVDGAGAGIGNGGDHDVANNLINGAEIAPDTSKLTPNGWIEYYAPGADMDTDAPVKVIKGKWVPGNDPGNAPAARTYEFGDRLNLNGIVWIIVGIDGDTLTLASVDAFSDEQLKDLEALIKTLLTEAQLAELLTDDASGARVFLLDDDIAEEYFNGESGHIMIRAPSSIFG